MSLARIDTERKLYVIDCGGGYSCLGFEHAEKRLKAVAKWMNWTPQGIGNDVPGTPEHYARYLLVMREGGKYAHDNATQCDAELIPEFIGLERRRVEVTLPNGEKSRFYIGKSTGWLPCHLEIKSSRSRGGGSVYFPEGSTFRVLKAAR